jgi:hypothetical protein
MKNGKKRAIFGLPKNGEEMTNGHHGSSTPFGVIHTTSLKKNPQKNVSLAISGSCVGPCARSFTFKALNIPPKWMWICVGMGWKGGQSMCMQMQCEIFMFSAPCGPSPPPPVSICPCRAPRCPLVHDAFLALEGPARLPSWVPNANEGRKRRANKQQQMPPPMHCCVKSQLCPRGLLDSLNLLFSLQHPQKVTGRIGAKPSDKTINKVAQNPKMWNF